MIKLLKICLILLLVCNSYYAIAESTVVSSVASVTTNEIGVKHVRLLLFTSPGCYGCIQIEPEIARFKQMGVRVDTFMMTKQDDVITKFKVKQFPTVIMITDYNSEEWYEVNRYVGADGVFTRIKDGMRNLTAGFLARRSQKASYAVEHIVPITVPTVVSNDKIATVKEPLVEHDPLLNSKKSVTDASVDSVPDSKAKLDVKEEDKVKSGEDKLSADATKDDTVTEPVITVPPVINTSDTPISMPVVPISGESARIIRTDEYATGNSSKQTEEERAEAVIDRVLESVSNKMVKKIEGTIDDSKKQGMAIIKEQVEQARVKAEATVSSWLMKIFWRACLIAAGFFVVITLILNWIKAMVLNSWNDLKRIYSGVSEKIASRKK